MTTPTGGNDPDQGWSQAPPPSQTPGMPPPPPQQQQQGGYTPPTYDQPYGGPPVGGGVPGGGAVAGFWIRFAGALIDGILLGIVAFIVGMIIGMNTTSGRNLLQTAFGAIYFTYFHGSTGQSLGQKLVSIKVVDEGTGGQIDYTRAFIRWLVSIVSGIVIALGYLWMLWDPKKQTWHDKAARTQVIKA